MHQEKAEWESLNKLLMLRGLKPVSLAAPQSCGNTSGTSVLDSRASLGIRLALKTLVEDTDRQQKMMQGLLEANRCLRDEIRQERGRASREEQRANDLENVVKTIKSKICQLEDETIAKVCQQQNQVKELQKDQQVKQYRVNVCFSVLENWLCLFGMRETPLFEAVSSEVQCRCVSWPLPKGWSWYLSGMILLRISEIENIIFLFFSKLIQFIFLNRQYKKDEDQAQREIKSKEEFLNLDATPKYRALLTSFQKQLTETKARNERLLLENINLKKDLEIRPTAQELKLYKHQVKKLEKTLKKTIQ
ncbi:CEP70 protein, partial [Oreotrochilus melanogaster]|nr:CEP70 protein [Oreotrochilus melanogaster]